MPPPKATARKFLEDAKAVKSAQGCAALNILLRQCSEQQGEGYKGFAQKWASLGHENPTCGRTKFYDAMRAFKEHGPLWGFTSPGSGGARNQAGRKRLGLPGAEGDGLGPEQSKKRQAKGNQERDVNTIAEWCNAEVSYRTYAQPPFHVPMPLWWSRACASVLAACVAAFVDVHERTPPELTVRGGGINDVVGTDEGTGQLRRLINPTPLVLRKEKIALAMAPACDHLITGSIFWRKYPDACAAVYNLAAYFSVYLRELPCVMKHAEPGFPGVPTEIEILETPGKKGRRTGTVSNSKKAKKEAKRLAEFGTPPQGNHQDSRFNILNLLVSVSVCGVRVLSTFVAKPDTDLSPGYHTHSTTPCHPHPHPRAMHSTPMPLQRANKCSAPRRCGTPIEYTQLPVNVFDGAATQALVCHAAWPHRGPGNVGDDDRYVLFYSFPLDTVAARHTTGEAVYYEEDFRNPNPIAYGASKDER